VAIATNVLAALTGSACDPSLTHRIDGLPHNGAVVTLLAACGSTHWESYFDIVMAYIVGPLIASAVVIVLGSMLGSFQST